MDNLYRRAALCKVFAGILIFCLSGLAQAAQSPVQSPSQNKSVQTQTVQALQALDKNQWSQGKAMIAATGDPLAAKLYYWLYFTRKDDVDDYTHLAQFIRQNPQWPGVSGMRAKAEKIMPESLRNDDVVAWFNDYPPKTAKGLDRYLEALTTSGRTDQAQTIIRKWWADITMSRDEQREIYRKYGRLIDKEAHRRRLDTLLFSGQYTNARGIAAVLEGGFPALTEARIALAAQKGDVNALIAKVPASLQNDPGLQYERLRWRRRAGMDVGAMEILNTAPKSAQIQNPKDWWQERHIVIRRLIEKKQYKSAYVLADGHRQTKDQGFPYLQAEWVGGWLALRFVNKPKEAYTHFNNLYNVAETPISKARGAYWAGRAAESIGDGVTAAQWYRVAAQFQTVYYGQLAGAKLGLAESLPNAAPPALTAADIAAIDGNELVEAAKLFYAAGMGRESGRFLTAFIDANETPKAYRFAAEMASKMKRYNDAVKIAKNATAKGLFLTAQSYPVVTDRLRGINTEWALIHGLIRQESMFDYDARSPVGALGLMQLMPATARETAAKLGIGHRKSWLTGNPDHNIRLGSAYLQRMLDRFGGSYPMAIAAYNAGPGRVDQWIREFGDPRLGQVDWIDWMETIPIYETRNYVQRVLEATYVYRLRLKGIQPTPISPIHIALAK
ncbi:MAG: lytic transglycosylase domain-containing protein [Bdellovibrionales bacterium]